MIKINENILKLFDSRCTPVVEEETEENMDLLNAYNSYSNYKDIYGDNSNYISQCLIAGGQDFEKCVGVDSKGSIYLLGNLKTCLIQKGWKTRANSIPKKGGAN